MRRSLVLTTVVLSALLVPAAPALAAPAPLLPVGGCNGASCEGKDPGALCQGDARTVDSLELSGATLELRYSPACGAIWARISGGWDAGSQFPPRAKIIRNQDGKSYGCSYRHGDQRACYTQMTNDTDRTAYAWGEHDTGVTFQRGRTGSY